MYGTRVINLDEASLRNELTLREAVERHAVRLLAENASEEVLNVLMDEARTIDGWMNDIHHDESRGTLLHLEFHLKLARATGFTSLEDTLKRSSMRTLLTVKFLKNQALPHPPDFHPQRVRGILTRVAMSADKKMREQLHFNEERKGRKKSPRSEWPAETIAAVGGLISSRRPF